MKRQKIDGKELEAIRKIYHGGIPIKIIASEIGIEVSTLYRWLDGSRIPGYLVTDKIRQFLKNHIVQK